MGPTRSPRRGAVPPDLPRPAARPLPAPSEESPEVERLCALGLSPAPGRIAGFFGPGAHRLALRAVARPLLAGHAVVVVDGGNLFDPYEVSRAERALGGSGREALGRLLVSRAFTCHQLEALLARRLAPAIGRCGARLVLVLGLAESFADADVPYREACRVFHGCLRALRRTAAGGVRVAAAGPAEEASPSPVLSLPGPEAARARRSGLFRHLLRTCDPLLRVRREGERTLLRLERGGGRR